MKNRPGWIFALLLMGAGVVFAQDAVDSSVVLELPSGPAPVLPVFPDPTTRPDYGDALIFAGEESIGNDNMVDEESATVPEAADEEAPAPEVEEEPAPVAPYDATVKRALQALESAGITYTPEEVEEAIWRGLFRDIPNFTLIETDEAIDDPQPEGDEVTTWEILPNKLGLLHLLYDGGGTMKATVQQALTEMQEAGVRGLVLDLRGTQTLPKDVVALLMPERLTAKYTGALPDWQIQGTGGLRPLEPVVVLVDESTTLDGEILAAVWAGRVALVGRETSGNPHVMAVYHEKLNGKQIFAPSGLLQIFEGQALKAGYNGLYGVKPTISISEEMEQEPVFEPVQPRLRKGQEITAEEKEDRALRDRTRKDVPLRYATDILLGLRATGYVP